MKLIGVIAATLALAATVVDAKIPGPGRNWRIKRRADAKKLPAKVPGVNNGAGSSVSTGAASGKPVKAWPGNPAGLVAFTRFNCAFPFCPTTALDVCVADEHYEPGRPIVIATLIPQTPTDSMGFFAYSDFDPVSRMHYTLAARQSASGDALNQIFTVYIDETGKNGSLVSGVTAAMPNGLDQSDIVYFSTYNGSVYTLFAGGQLVQSDPASGNTTNVFTLNSDPTLAFTLACANDQVGGQLFINGIKEETVAPSPTYWLTTFNYASGTARNVGPLGPTPWIEPIWNYTRDEQAVSSLTVYTPPEVGKGLQLLELRNSDDAPFFFAAWLDPVTGNSTLIPLPEDWYLDWEVDPQVFPDQWAGSQRRVWSYDWVNNYMWALLYDECGGTTDDCDENQALVWMEWLPHNYTDWYVAAEPVEPELTQLVWINTTQNY